MPGADASSAPAIFSNNDLRCGVSKTRVQLFADSAGVAVTNVHAKNMPPQDALRERTGSVVETIRRLHRRDRKIGELYGMWPPT